MLSSISVELPWNAFTSLVIFLSLYYSIGMYRNAIPTNAATERGGLMYLLLLSFMLFASTFTSMVIAGVGSAEIGAIIALVCLPFIWCSAGKSIPSMPSL